MTQVEGIFQPVDVKKGIFQPAKHLTYKSSGLFQHTKHLTNKTHGIFQPVKHLTNKTSGIFQPALLQIMKDQTNTFLKCSSASLRIRSPWTQAKFAHLQP